LFKTVKYFVALWTGEIFCLAAAANPTIAFHRSCAGKLEPRQKEIAK
jgi:hypothetical protein